MLFPHNSMFAGYHTNKKAMTYSLKINGFSLHYTDKAWWKKDFLETNATEYGRYYEAGQQTLLENYIKIKWQDTGRQQFLLHSLTAGKITPQQWAAFYAKMAGTEIKAGDSVALVRYELNFSGRPVITDSSIIFNFRQP